MIHNLDDTDTCTRNLQKNRKEIVPSVVGAICASS